MEDLMNDDALAQVKRAFQHFINRVRELSYVTYPNYHDETYADWSL